MRFLQPGHVEERAASPTSTGGQQAVREAPEQPGTGNQGHQKGPAVKRRKSSKKLPPTRGGWTGAAPVRSNQCRTFSQQQRVLSPAPVLSQCACCRRSGIQKPEISGRTPAPTRC